MVEKYLRDPIKVPIGNLFPDPNNPRLALEETPGYSDAKALFDETTRKKILEEIGGTSYGISDLVESISNQGWVNIDAILVWQHPDDPHDFVVTEGNRLTRRTEPDSHRRVDKARKKLQRMQAKATSYSKSDIAAAQSLVDRLELIVADTEMLSVFPIDANTPEELKRKLPRVLAVRHISHAKEWGSYAEDVWLLRRYEQLFADTHGSKQELSWDNTLIKTIAQEASLGDTLAKRKIRAAKWLPISWRSGKTNCPRARNSVRPTTTYSKISARSPVSGRNSASVRTTWQSPKRVKKPSSSGCSRSPEPARPRPIRTSS